jgi:hypothetical protein
MVAFDSGGKRVPIVPIDACKQLAENDVILGRGLNVSGSYGIPNTPYYQHAFQVAFSTILMG